MKEKVFKQSDDMTVSAESFFVVAIVLILCKDILQKFFSLFTSHPTAIITILVYTFVLITFCIAKIPLRQYVRSVGFLAILIFCIFLTIKQHPEYDSMFALEQYNIWNLLSPISNIFLLSLCIFIVQPKTYYKIFKIYSFIQFPYCFYLSLSVIKQGYWLKEVYDRAGELVTISSPYNLDWGYEMMFCCIIFYVFFYVEKNGVYLLPVIIGLIEILLFGSRGPLAIFLIFVILMYAFYYPKKMKMRTILILILSIIMLLSFESGILQELIISATNRLHINSRTIEKLATSSITDDSGRGQIYTVALDMIKEKFWQGYGVYGDRFVLRPFVVAGSTAYSHNIFLEMIITFGFFGVFIIAWIIYRTISLLRNLEFASWRPIIFICLGCSLNLILSSSFWYQSFFWCLLAILINLKRNANRSELGGS